MAESTNFNFPFVSSTSVVSDFSKISSPVQNISGGSNWKTVSFDFGNDYSVRSVSGVITPYGSLEVSASCDVNGFCAIGNLSGNNWGQIAVVSGFNAASARAAAIKTDGTLWLWGTGSNGALGNNSTINRSSPVQTSCQGNNWKQVAITAAGTTAAVKTDGTLWTWGSNFCSGLGNGGTANRSMPIQTTSGGTNWKCVCLEGDIAGTQGAAIKTDGTLWVWGFNSVFGGLGLGVAGPSRVSVPTSIGGNNWSKINQIGPCVSSAIKTDGTLWLWGLNSGFGGNYGGASAAGGSLGNNSTLDRSSPVQTSCGGTNWKCALSGSVGESGWMTAAIKTDGTLWTWGPNSIPQFGPNFGIGNLGNNSTISRSNPVQTAAGGTNWISVIPGASMRARKADGTLWEWGSLSLDSRSSPVSTGTTGWVGGAPCEVKTFGAGGNFSASVKTDGTLWLWGSGANGRLGNNSTLNVCSPVQTVSQTTNWRLVSLGNNFSAAVKTDGTLWLWGSNANGQLGTNSTITESLSPVQTVSSTTDWKQISAGTSFVAAIKNDNTLWTWGLNSTGQLGNSSSINRSSPVQTVSSTTNWKQVSSGSGFVSATKIDGTLWTWGRAASGELGNNSTINRSSPVQTSSATNCWNAVEVGGGHAAAVKTDGTLWLWGCGALGRLGNNSTLNRSSPVQTVSTESIWKTAILGCNHSAAIKTDGTLWMWGEGLCGKLGNLSVTDRSSPNQTSFACTDWLQVSLGDTHTLGTAIPGRLYGWGDNSVGQLGCDLCAVATTTFCTRYDFDDVFVRKDIFSEGGLWIWGCNQGTQLGDNSTINRSSPVQAISGGTNWKQVSLGYKHSAAIKTDGTLWLWGVGDYGRLGNNSAGSRASPVQTVSATTDWKQVSLGFFHSAAIKTDGTLWLWGASGYGVLGNNSTIDRSSPVQTVSATANWKQVSLGCRHSAAIKTDGTLWLWGANGLLGDNTLSGRSSPVQTASSGNNWKQVSLGRSHSAAVKTDGTLWTWGLNGCGQLGDNTTTNRDLPAQTVSATTDWKQVSLGFLHSAAIKTDGTLWLWGGGRYGRLGNNSTLNRSSPVQTVSATTNWKQVSIGCFHSAAIKTDGTLWLWGDGGSGILGNNSTIDRSSPVQTISADTNWKQVSLGYVHSASIREDCW